MTTSLSRFFDACCVFALTALPLVAQSDLPHESAARATAGPSTALRASGALASDQPRLLPGDAANGRVLVESSTCLDCHRLDARGSRLGPDLSEIGKLRSPDELQRAIVAPDADVLPQHRFVRLVTRDGTAVSGRLLNQDAFSIQLIDVNQQLKSYLKTSLREHTILDKGLMPSFEGKLTPQQVADIVSYLGSLKGAEQ